MWGYVIKDLIPSWKVQPGIYGMLAATGVLGSVFRCVHEEMHGSNRPCHEADDLSLTVDRWVYILLFQEVIKL
jgi:hypothetical protein